MWKYSPIQVAKGDVITQTIYLFRHIINIGGCYTLYILSGSSILESKHHCMLECSGMYNMCYVYCNRYTVVHSVRL